MNIKDLPQGSYKPVSQPQTALNVNNLPAGSYKPVTAPTDQPAAPQKDFLQKAADVASVVPGTKTLGEYFGTKFGRLYNAGKEALGLAPKGSTANYDQTVPGPAKLAGAFAQTASTVLGAALPLPKAATVLGAAGKAALQTGALSAASGAGATAESGGDLKAVAKNAFLSGLSGAAIGGAAGAFSKGVEKLAQNNPEHLYNNALRVTSKMKENGRSPSTFLKDEGVWGNLGTFSKASDEGINTESAAIKSKIAERLASKGDVSTFYPDVKTKAVEALQKEFGDLYSRPELEQMIDSVPVAGLRDAKEGLGLEATDAIRSKLGGLIGSNKWVQQNPTQNTQAAKAVYRVLADTVKSNTDTATEFGRLSKWLDTRKVVNRALHLADSKYGLGLYDIIGGGTGAVLGGLQGEGDPLTRIKNAALGGLAGVALERGVNSPALKTGFAQALTKLPRVPLGVVGQAGRAGVTQGLGKVFSSTSR